jgi:hypothetical protein
LQFNNFTNDQKNFDDKPTHRFKPQQQTETKIVLESAYSDDRTSKSSRTILPRKDDSIALANDSGKPARKQLP